MPAWSKARREEEWADSGLALPELVRAEPRQVRVAPVLEHRELCSQLWVLGRLFSLMIPRSLVLSAPNIRPLRWPTSEFTECPCCSSIQASRISVFLKRSLLDRAF